MVSYVGEFCAKNFDQTMAHLVEWLEAQGMVVGADGSVMVVEGEAVPTGELMVAFS